MEMKYKKIACFLPGLGAPVSLYYLFTNKELKDTALKGLMLIPLAVIVLSMSEILPSLLTLLAGAYIYWGVMAMAGGWGFLTILVAWNFMQRKAIPLLKARDMLGVEASELVPNASVSEVLPDLDADALLSGIEKLPREEREQLVEKIRTRN